MPGKIIHKFGAGVAIGTSFAPLTNLGALNWLQAATAVRVKAGGNAADTAAGAGAQTVTVEGLDENWEFASETLTLAGASASSATTTTFVRVNRAYVATIGAYGAANTGNITIENGAGGTDLIKIDAGEGQSQYGAYSVPAGNTIRLKHISIFSDSNKKTTVRMFVRESADDVTTPFAPKRLKWYLPGASDKAQLPYTGGFVISEKTDVWFEGKVDSGTADASVNFEMEEIKTSFS